MTRLLHKIDDPSQLRALAESDLPLLASEVRELTIDTVARTGGHLGASLGVVELAIALHYVFNTPEDRLIWDVGHQSYPHKILTGRRERMHTLRQHSGLSGFTKRSESPYDPFGAGHSSTSISAAMGMAIAARQKGEKRKCIAVIGDGAMTAGMSFEALNDAGQHRGLGLVVVLNDNEMSISPNVGAMSAYLSRILSGRVYTTIKDNTGRVLKKISEPLLGAARRAEEHMKGMITPGTLFEELGFTYFGPIDGHDFSQLLPTLRNIQRLSGPILLHVVTRKGKGFPPAEASPCTYHGVQPFDRATGRLQANGSIPSFTQVFSETLVNLAEKDRRIVAITAAMPEGTGLSLFQKRFPERFFDVGIAEQHAVTFAAGMACEGFLPVVAIYSTFLQRAYDQIIHDVALQKLPMILAVDRGGIVGEDGATHAGAFDLTFLRVIPDLVLMAPADENELRHMLATALASGCPVALRYPRGAGMGLDPALPAPLPLGVGRKLRDGKSLAIVAIGSMVQAATGAAELLKREGIQAAVYDARFIKPLDTNLLREAAGVGSMLILEENSVRGGFGAAVLEFLAEDGFLESGLRVRTWGLPDAFIPQGSRKELRVQLNLDAEGVARQARELMRLRQSAPLPRLAVNQRR
ncbi:MAG: 1-deoxy-D-xylulose-5-phosphate synthase [Magnetococcales bacterium]|nr:1-deoxy-D-xylulose-5-phosphate synthase [Magnetococcales bacterium]